MRPGLTTATQYSGAPLPLPIRVSAGFFVIGLSGNILIQILPPRLMWRVIAIRAEADAVAARRHARHASLHLLPVLDLLRHQHDEYPLAISIQPSAFS